MKELWMGINLIVHLFPGGVSISIYSKGLYRGVFGYIDKR